MGPPALPSGLPHEWGQATHGTNHAGSEAGTLAAGTSGVSAVTRRSIYFRDPAGNSAERDAGRD